MFKDQLFRLRIQQGMTQSALAKKLGLMPSTISMYEQGKRHPKQEILIKLAKCLGVSVDCLLDIPTSYRNRTNLDELSQSLYSMFSTLEGQLFRGKTLTAREVDQIMKMVIDGIQKGVLDQDR